MIYSFPCAASALLVTAEIFLQDLQSILPQNALRDLRLPERMIKHHSGAVAALVSKNGLQLDVAGAVHQSAQLYPHHRAAAHEAGFAAGIDGVFVQVGDAGLRAKRPDQARLAVEGGIVLRVDLILIGEHDLAVLHQHRTERLVAMAFGS